MVIGTKSDYHLFVYIPDSVYLCNVQNTLPLLTSNGEALTALTEGLHIIVFDKQNNKLQLIV